MPSDEAAWQEHMKEQFGGLQGEHQRLLADLRNIASDGARLWFMVARTEVVAMQGLGLATVGSMLTLSTGDDRRLRQCLTVMKSMVQAARSTLEDLGAIATAGGGEEQLMKRVDGFLDEYGRLIDIVQSI